MKRKGIFALVILVLWVSTVSSCNSTSSVNTLEVVSASYPGLTELPLQEPDPDEIKKVIFPDLYEYFGHRCHMSSENGKVVISDKDSFEDTHIFEGNYGYFIGVDLGEFGGYCQYYEYGSTVPKIITEDNCFGLIKINNDMGYLISGKPKHMSFPGEGHVTKLIRDKDKDYWRTEVVTDFSDSPRCYVYSETDNTLYVSTSSALLKLDLNNGLVSELTVPEYWYYLFQNSMIILENKLLIGTVVGVFEHDLDSGKNSFYLMEYEKYLVD